MQLLCHIMAAVAAARRKGLSKHCGELAFDLQLVHVALWCAAAE
jgi:hypothetical protein